MDNPNSLHELLTLDTTGLDDGTICTVVDLERTVVLRKTATTPVDGILVFAAHPQGRWRVEAPVRAVHLVQRRRHPQPGDDT